MTVRLKITLLISAAGFLSSLVFSGIVLWEMLEQPFHIIDSDLESTARRAIQVLAAADAKAAADGLLSAEDEPYWLEIRDGVSGNVIYRSKMARRIEIPEQAFGSRAKIHRAISRQTGDRQQDQEPGNEVSFRVRKFDMSQGGRTFQVRAGRPIENLEEEIWDTTITVACGLVFSGFLLMGISFLTAGFILKPIQRMNELARDISEKHLERRLPLSTGRRDEFSALAQTLNRVFDRLQHAFLQQKRLLADASHELKTPLTMMRLALDEIHSELGETGSDPQAESHERMTEQVLRMERLVKSLLDLSSLEIEAAVTRAPIDLGEILKSLIAEYRFMADVRGIAIRVTLPERLEMAGDADKLARAFSNILDNAVKYAADGGQVEVVGERSDADWKITVVNDGPGVPASEISRVFEQFYRVEQSRSLRLGGSGLGLAIVKRIIELHGGAVQLASEPGRWTRVTVTLSYSHPGPILKSR
ncbi:sensor histidine kinase [Desulfatirhabdium butyrativorans]|uniref:sensor histidine kinase n=1 Tax=Desulfatirhabdium butyrativorans TaxID=340467 RepID=UPI000408572E|nr:HAMP domain-containing sensor histidine kinase [Desulfatirhabdium butyrativorans]